MMMEVVDAAIVAGQAHPARGTGAFQLPQRSVTPTDAALSPAVPTLASPTSTSTPASTSTPMPTSVVPAATEAVAATAPATTTATAPPLSRPANARSGGTGKRSERRPPPPAATTAATATASPPAHRQHLPKVRPIPRGPHTNEGSIPTAKELGGGKSKRRFSRGRSQSVTSQGSAISGGTNKDDSGIGEHGDCKEGDRRSNDNRDGKDGRQPRGRPGRRGSTGARRRRRSASVSSAISSVSVNHALQTLRSAAARYKFPKDVLNLLTSFSRNYLKLADFESAMRFLERCKALRVVPQKYRLSNSRVTYIRAAQKILDRFSTYLMLADLDHKRMRCRQLRRLLSMREDELRRRLPSDDLAIGDAPGVPSAASGEAFSGDAPSGVANTRGGAPGGVAPDDATKNDASFDQRTRSAAAAAATGAGDAPSPAFSVDKYVRDTRAVYEERAVNADQRYIALYNILVAEYRISDRERRDAERRYEERLAGSRRGGGGGGNSGGPRRRSEAARRAAMPAPQAGSTGAASGASADDDNDDSYGGRHDKSNDNTGNTADDDFKASFAPPYLNDDDNGDHGKAAASAEFCSLTKAVGLDGPAGPVGPTGLPTLPLVMPARGPDHIAPPVVAAPAASALPQSINN